MSPVFIEERDYRIKPGKAGLFVSTYEQYGLGLQKKYLGKFLGYFMTEVGARACWPIPNGSLTWTGSPT